MHANITVLLIVREHSFKGYNQSRKMGIRGMSAGGIG